ncbi:MAG TPA: hypothetical protein VFH72_04535 [Candidatus Baltobacteraceae bacterium]|jgi:hypothetical protein|nr:hypothetical protein [Candidatus Baltobacteraceae bacterium]
MPELTIDEQLDQLVEDLGVRFDGVRDGALVFVPANGKEISDSDAVLDQIAQKILSNPIKHELADIESIELAAA